MKNLQALVEDSRSPEKNIVVQNIKFSILFWDPQNNFSLLSSLFLYLYCCGTGTVGTINSCISGTGIYLINYGYGSSAK
jgi:hypothetical protein